jgi:Flp pilus assembly protein protease CpaA
MGFCSEALAPLLVLLVALPANGILVGTPQSFAVMFCYALVAGALKVFVVDAARERMESSSLVHFFIGSGVFYGFLALGMLKLFEVATS